MARQLSQRPSFRLAKSHISLPDTVRSVFIVQNLLWAFASDYSAPLQVSLRIVPFRMSNYLVFCPVHLPLARNCSFKRSLLQWALCSGLMILRAVCPNGSEPDLIFSPCCTKTQNLHYSSSVLVLSALLCPPLRLESHITLRPNHLLCAGDF